MKNELTIRKARAEDVPAINDILNQAIENTCVNWAWNKRSLEDAQKWFDEHDNERYCIYVAEVDGTVAGYGSLSAFRNREGYWPVAENSVYVHKDFRGRKIGSTLLKKLIDNARESGLGAITAWIDSENRQSIKLHEKYGFYITGEMKNVGEKLGERRSVTIMQIDFNELGDENDRGK